MDSRRRLPVSLLSLYFTVSLLSMILQTMYGQKKIFSTFSYNLVQISPIMILVNSGAFLSISSWFCELTELSFVMIPYISSTGYPPKTQGIMGRAQVANEQFDINNVCALSKLD